jgi:hypothetical protein
MFKKLLPLLFLFAGFQVSAAPILVYDAGKVIGIDELAVNGTDYNFIFSSEGTASDIWGPGASGLSGGISTVRVFMRAVASFLESETVHRNDIFGCVTLAVCGIQAAYDYSIVDDVYSVAIARSKIQFNGGAWNGSWTSSVNGSFDYGAYGDYQYRVYATWSAVVPEPSIIALFSLGLFGLGFARRR